MKSKPLYIWCFDEVEADPSKRIGACNLSAQPLDSRSFGALLGNYLIHSPAVVSLQSPLSDLFSHLKAINDWPEYVVLNACLVHYEISRTVTIGTALESIKA